MLSFNIISHVEERRNRITLMKHLIVFFYFISFTVGFSFLLLGMFLWFKNKLEKLKLFIFCSFALTLILIEQMITAYDIVNAVENQSLNIVIRNISAIGCGLMIYSLTKLIILFLEIPRTRKIEVLLVSGSLFPIILINLYHLTGFQLLLRIANTEFFGIILYDIILLSVSFDKIENLFIKLWVKRIIIISLLMFPLMFLDAMVEKLPNIGIYFPFGLFTVFLYYAILSSLGLYYILRYFNTLFNPMVISDLSEHKQEKKNTEGRLEDLLVIYNITNREKEIIQLLVNGYSYQNISEKLIISLPTVKSHVYNIYRKLGIKNKIELINRISSQE